jgi:hypothetical protein
MAQQLDLMKLVLEVDNHLIEKGVEPFKRPFQACLVIADRLAPRSAIPMNDPLFQSINHIYKKLYRPVDLYMPPLSTGQKL